MIGALIGLVGTVVLFAGKGLCCSSSGDFLPGLYAAAFVAAFVWATYSVLSRLGLLVGTDRRGRGVLPCDVPLYSRRCST